MTKELSFALALALSLMIASTAALATERSNGLRINGITVNGITVNGQAPNQGMRNGLSALADKPLVAQAAQTPAGGPTSASGLND